MKIRDAVAYSILAYAAYATVTGLGGLAVETIKYMKDRKKKD